MVSNQDVFRILERIADLLEIKGENQFKSRAYRQAAVQAENAGRPLIEIAAAEGLRSIDGFGPAIADKVEELLNTGRLGYLEALEAEIPPTLLEIRHLPGVGPKTAALLWHEAGITTLDELRVALQCGSLAGIPRLGEKSLQKIADSLSAQERHGVKRRRERTEIEAMATDLVEILAQVPGVERAELAGSYRRGNPTLGDLDIVAATTEPQATLVAFSALPQVEKVLLRGDTKCSVEVLDGFQVDCRAVPPISWGAAMQYFTGSQAHNVWLRGRALRMGLTLNEYGLFRIDDGQRVDGETEAGIYGKLNLPYIEPCDRNEPHPAWISDTAHEPHVPQEV